MLVHSYQHQFLSC